MADNEPNANSTRTRTLLIIVSIMILIGAVVAIYSFSKGRKTNKMASPTSGVPNNIYVTPGAKSSEKYAKLQEAANVAGTKQADAKGKTFVPTIIGNKSEDTSQDLNNQLNNILKDKITNNADYEKLSKQLAALLAELNKHGNSIDNLLHLIQELQKRGYNVADLENLLKKLIAEGYNADELAAMLAQLKAQGYKVTDLESMLRRLLKEGYNPEIINKILEQLLKDKLKELEDAIKKLQQAGYDVNNLKNLEKQANNPDLAKLLEQLANQGYKVDSLENLLKQLMDKGYNIFDWNVMLQQLQKDGYSVDQLQKLLAQLKADGKDIKDLKSLLDALAQQNAKLNATQHTTQNSDQDQPLKNLAVKDQLRNVFNTNHNAKSTNGSSSSIDQDYAALIKKQQDAALAEANARKLAEERLLRDKQAALNSEAQQKAMSEILANMRAETDLAATTWNSVPQQTFVQGDLAAGKATDKSSGAQADNNNLSPLQLKKLNNLENSENNIIKAGTIVFAVLETAVNSDEPGPILARIVQPPLKDTKLIGTVQASTNQNSETLTLNFNTANIPERTRSYGISAVAIDPNTARTALASDVDHHYLLRWGTVFAATFLQGYSKGVAQAGTTVDSTTSGGLATTVTKQSPLKPKQQVFQGLGDMATSWGKGVSQFSNRPVTITINSGVSLGILFTSDFTIPSSDEVTPTETPKPVTPENNNK